MTKCQCFHIIIMENMASIRLPSLGVKSLMRDIKFMLGIDLGLYWKVCWAFIVPGALTFFFVYYLFTFPVVKYGGIPLPQAAISEHFHYWFWWFYTSRSATYIFLVSHSWRMDNFWTCFLSSVYLGMSYCVHGEVLHFATGDMNISQSMTANLFRTV